MKLAIEPTTLKHANGFVQLLHRHHPPARGCVFTLACVEGDRVRGVAIVGRPNARMLQDGTTCEVTRVCTDGTRNACSMLYGAVARVARQMGYERVYTYTLPEEGGASLRAAGWHEEEALKSGRSWSRSGRPRTDKHPTTRKARWSAPIDRVPASTADVCKTCGTVWYADADNAPEDWTPCYCDLDRPSPSTAPGLKAHGDAAETPNACRNVSAAQKEGPA